ncbi:hypothetical protein [Methylobacterium sp. Leaf456]|uniref:hypothetical protein n=1 Tax=Methylobacterium sp. Leaf456 TaxID=1736382 RepID=UPI000A4C972B|nr:hypothetical protein [Methylobacterium sp. Leaf456]
MHPHVVNLIENLKHRHQGIVASCKTQEYRDIISDGEGYSLVKNTCAMHRDAQEQIKNVINYNGSKIFEEVFENIISDKQNFKHPACWALFWAITEAEHETAKLYEMDTHEPELNGALISQIASCVPKFIAYSRAVSTEGFKECVIVDVFNLATKGNEARTGADMGVIIDQRRGNNRVVFPALFQAKRAHERTVDVYRKAGVTSTQLEQLLLSGIGNYLFYNEFDKATFPPTAMSAELVDKFYNKGHSVWPLFSSNGFAATIAFGLALGEIVGTVRCHSPEDALLKIYNPDIKDIDPGFPLVCVLNDREFTFDERVDIENEWRDLVNEAKEDLKNGVKPFSGRGGSIPGLGS